MNSPFLVSVSYITIIHVFRVLCEVRILVEVFFRGDVVLEGNVAFFPEKRCYLWKHCLLWPERCELRANVSFSRERCFLSRNVAYGKTCLWPERCELEQNVALSEHFLLSEKRCLLAQNIAFFGWNVANLEQNVSFSREHCFLSGKRSNLRKTSILGWTLRTRAKHFLERSWPRETVCELEMQNCLL